MKKHRMSRLLSILLLAAMLLSLMPAAAASAEEPVATWSRVSLEDLSEGDIAAITMTSESGTTYILPNASVSKGPAAVPVTINNGTLYTEGAVAYAWSVFPNEAEEGTYTITGENGGLSITSANNGVKIGADSAAWRFEQEHLTAVDPKGTQRFLGATTAGANGPDWRCYTSVNNNIAGTTQFWVLNDEGELPIDETIPTPAPTEEPATEVVLSKFTSAPEDGDLVAIYHPSSDTVLSENANGNKLSGVTASMKDDQIVLADGMAYMTVHVNDGVYSFENNGLFLTSPETGNGLSFAAEESDYSGWTLQSSSDGHWMIVNNKALYKEKQQALEYFNSLYTTYGVGSGNAFLFDFYGEVEEEPEVKSGIVTDLAQLTDGAKVVILNPANNKALSQTYSGYYNAGVDVALTDGVLTGYGESEIWTIGKNEDGSYTFSTADGKKLAMAASRTSMPLDEENPNWTITPADGSENGFYIENVARTGYRIEWYANNNNWSAYNKNTTGDLFIQQFYLVPDNGDTPGGGDEPGVEGLKVGTLVTSLDQLIDGATVLIYSPGHKTAINSDSSGDWYLTADKLTDSFTKDHVFTVSVKDGVYSFSNGTRVISAWLSGNYVELTINPEYNPDTKSGWKIDPCNETNHTWYIYSSELQGQYGNCYIEAYVRNSNEVFSGYSTTKLNEMDFGLQFYLVDPSQASVPADDGEWDGVLTDGAQYVVYNASAQGVFGIPTESGISLTNIPTTIESGKAVVSNGALVFTVGSTGRYYTFEIGGKYLASNAKEDLFFQDEIDNYAKWYLNKNGDGYILYNKAAKYGSSPVCIEYYSSMFSGWTFKSAEADIFRFNFYPVADGTTVINGVAQVPTVSFDCEDSRYIEQDYAVKFSLDDLAETINEVTVSLEINGVKTALEGYEVEGRTYTITIPAAVLDAAEEPIASFKVIVEVKNSNNLSYSGVKTVTVLDEPFIGKLTPAANAQTLDDKKPVISAEIGNVGENAVFTMTINDESVEATFADGKLSYQSAEDMADGRYTVKVTVTRADGKSAEKTWSFTVGKADFQLYFGQLHSHTTYSDGSGTLSSALEYIEALPASSNVQFVAFTDHSNYFDTTSAANPEQGLYDTSLMTEASQKIWAEYKNTVADFNATHSDLIAIAGFEMTWSGGPGHINTFNTPGIVSRNNTTLNNKSNDAGMKAYYALLAQEEGANSLSQFNHPGTTFGNFTDFSYWDAVTDSRIFLVEVGNGEGQIGAGGYYPSYEQYILALDKGWHVAPTNNQDNHKGRWGNANDARDVIYTDNFSEEGIYDAIRQLRVYATEDKNLEINYTVNGEPLGTIFSEVPEKLNIAVTLYDPDSSDSISKVEVVVNSGKVAYTWADAADFASGSLEVELDPNYSYYFIRVTQADGDLAVTAPVWVGESLKLGISEVTASQATPVTGEELTLTTTFFNSESSAATVKSIVYSVQGGEVIGTDSEPHTVAASSNSTVSFSFTPDKARHVTIDVTATVELNGEEFTFTKSITLDIKDADSLVYIGIDASHYNEYVAGNYKDSMTNFSALAAEYAVRTVQLNTSEELIEACGNEKYAGLILTAPSRRDGTALRNPYATYSDEEIAAIKAFNEAGGMVILTGWGDYYESYAEFPAADHMAAQQNKLLEALGSSIRIGDDEAVDDELNGGQNMRLYFNAFNFESPLMEGIVVDADHPNDRLYTEVFSNYGGSSVYFTGSGVPATVTPVVFGHASTYTVDNDKDGSINTLKYPYTAGDDRVVIMATEELDGRGLIIVSGAAFMSNFEVQAQISSGSSDSDQQKNYANYKVCENLVKGLNKPVITPIATVQAQTMSGLIYTIEGTVTSNASGFDKDTAFFDCIYVQDATAGVCCFPVAGNFKIGDVVRITGYTDFYQGEMELQVQSIAKIGESNPVEPREVTAKEVNERTYLGSLVTVKGTVDSFEVENGLVISILVKDAAGDLTRVFIDGYITTANEVKDLAVGAKISATGLSSFDNTWHDTNYYPRIRVRDRADVVCSSENTILVTVFSRALIANGDIGMNYYLKIADELLADENAYITINGEKYLISEAARVKRSGVYVSAFTYTCPLKCINDPVTLRAYDGNDALVGFADKNGTDVTETGYLFSARDYINLVLNAYGPEDKLTVLVKALSDFAGSAQHVLNYKVDTAVPYYNDLDAVTEDDFDAYAFEKPVFENMGISYASGTLVLESKTLVRHYFTLSEGSIEDYTFTVDGTEVEPTAKGTRYYIEFGGFEAKSLDKARIITVTDKNGNSASYSYSPMNYAYLAVHTDNQALKDLSRAMYLYFMAAKDYFA